MNGCGRCDLLRDAGVDGQRFYDDGYKYHVGKAREILKATPRDPIVIPPLDAYAAVHDANIHVRHSQHVDTRYPSIAIRRKGKYVLIDGNHRAYSRLFRKLPVKAYLLTPQEVRKIAKKA